MAPLYRGCSTITRINLAEVINESFDLTKVFIPSLPSIQYCPIGSRVYLSNPGQDSDYDIMFNSYDRTHVLNHLDKMSVRYSEGLMGSVKFGVSLLGIKAIEVNFCFIDDYNVWEKATGIMATIFEDTRICSFYGSKEGRMKLFKRIVEAMGGKGVLLPDYSS